MITTFQGYEGDDLAYHIGLLGRDLRKIKSDVLFIPLNNHYGLHSDTFVEETVERSQSARAVIFYDLVNAGDWEQLRFASFIKQFPHTNKHYLTVNQSGFQLRDVNTIPWDFMWNRFKAYYTEPIPDNLYLHHWAGPNAYILPDLTVGSHSKKFMSLCGREYGYRTHLYEVVQQYDGYISNRSKGRYLEGEEVIGAFRPVPNSFYQDSCLSVYVESNCIRPELIHITEKTFDPLVKGHFILPYSNPGTVRRIQDLGFRLPNFIDYTYDQEQDPQLRFERVVKEFERLVNLDLQQLHSQHTALFKHNQTCIHTIPYDDRVLRIFDV